MSDLYKIGRLVNDQKFITIVEAGMLKHAQSVPMGSTAPANEKNFAIWVLKNPMQPEPSMIALVASDPTVLSKTTMSGDVTNVENVPDADVSAVVSARWSLVASKFSNYAANQTPSGPAA